jgi:hypothetical protein
MMLRNLDEDVAVSVALLEHLPADQRAAWVPRLGGAPTVTCCARPRRTRAHQTDRARQVTAIIDDSLQHRYPLQARQVARLPERFEVELRLHDGTPLTIEVTPSGLPLARGCRRAAGAAGAAAGVRVAGGAPGHAPLPQLSHAVEHLQPGKDGPALPEDGPAEVGGAAAASTHCRHAFVAMSVSACRSWPRSRMTCRPHHAHEAPGGDPA